VGVVAEGDLELGPVPARAVDEARGPRITQRADVDLQRLQHRLRRLLQAAEDCLTADDDKLVKAGHVRGGRDDMCQLIRTQARSLLARFAGAQAR
jgi:hypothetical protein